MTKEALQEAYGNLIGKAADDTEGINDAKDGLTKVISQLFDTDESSIQIDITGPQVSVNVQFPVLKF